MSLDRIRAGGWRARIGVIVPPSNTVNETEFNRLKPDGVTFHFTRSPLHPDPAADDFSEMMQDIDRACGDLAACAVDLVAYGCTSGSMACPADRLLGRMRDASGVEGLSTAGAILAALNALGATRIAMATPYTDETNAHEAEFLERHGIEVVAASGLGLNVSLEKIQRISRVAPKAVFDHAMAVDRPEAEALLICCTDFNTVDAIEPLEQALGKPVVTSNAATLWASLRAAGIEDRIEGYGRLLREF
ncbi:MAG: aspartate/glutamate racemase family protein [Defluviicoccus sp.]|nr:aspartate/glutamate racemase family protein [Defluviicoccus sp.]